MKNSYLVILFILYLPFSFFAKATQCNIDFNYGIIIDEHRIRILEKQQTLIQISNQQQVFVGGVEIHLSPFQINLIHEYSQTIREQVPQIVSIALESVNLGLKSVDRVIASLTGENSAIQQKLNSRFKELEWRLKARFNHSDNSYFIASQDFDDFDDILEGTFENEIKEIVSKSIGTLLVAVGEAVANKSYEDEPLSDTEKRINTFDERMKLMGEEIDLEISPQAKLLENRAENFCNALRELDQLEEKINQQIPALKDLNLLVTQ
ncbi:DUF2884 family protein [Thalassotalea profundi]|uniref:DUF2884 family protein n=1 Tax=Thalassotalea profundi TaxID=2036687 RepID=A0ABQ3ILY1_9GAMM|nr:DUF2884 family protein [Thalassotalea profundi]GHE86764.1 hypothetical protein GCM10011501_14990 [Thalassotalea profundi]